MNIPTIFALQGGLLLVAAVTMYVNWRMNPSLPETKLWAQAFGWMVLAAFLLSGSWGDPEQSTVPSRLLVIVGNVVYALSFVLFNSGARCVTDRCPLRLSSILWIVITLGVVQAVADFGTDHGAILRPAISTTGLTLISASTTWVLFVAADRMTAPRGLFAAFSIMGTAALGLRSVLLILSGLGWVVSEFLRDALPFYGLSLMISGYTVAFILLAVHTLNEQLRTQAARDPLTGAYNRRAFAEITRPIIATAKREAVLVGVAMFDLDNFKRINDDHGHVAGDRMLQLFVDVAQMALRAGDVFARYGGEEFVALFVGTKRENVVVVAERVRSAFAEVSIVIEGKRLSTTVSVGISFFADDESELGPAVQRADEALYQAKESGRNRYVVAAHG